MILCARCDAVVEHVDALLGHYQEVHGGVPKMRYPDEKPLAPDSTRMDKLRRQRMMKYYRWTGRGLGGKWAS